MKILPQILAVVLLASFTTTGVLAGSTSLAMPGKADTHRLRWKGSSVKIAISNSLVLPSSNIKVDSDVLGAISRSLRAWQDAADIEFTTEFSEKSDVSSAGVSGDGVSLITVAQSADNVLLFAKNPLAESAKTRVFYNAKGFITEADIVLNPYQQFSTDGTFGTFDLESTLTHEIGHLLGLRHSNVLGSTMSESLSKNGTFGLADFGARTLADTDIAAVRELYGIASGDGACCSSITGKLTTGTMRPLKDLRVWAEEAGTGRVAANVEAAADGSFRLGGLPEGNYSVFWQRSDESAASPVGDLGTIKLGKGETRSLNERINPARAGLTLNYVGINNRLSDSAVSLEPGREYTVFLGGKNLNTRGVAVEFNSRFLKAARNSITEEDFGEGLSVISFTLIVDEKTPAGVYSVFASAADGSIASLVGALSVQ